MSDTTKQIESEIRDIENKIQRMINGEIKHKDGTPVQYPQHFIGVWMARISELDDKKFNISLIA